MEPKSLLTAADLWHVHRAALGGVSSVTGAPLPPLLAECPPGAQGAHYALAVAVAMAASLRLPPLPPGVTPTEAQRLRDVVRASLSELGVVVLCDEAQPAPRG